MRPTFVLPVHDLDLSGRDYVARLDAAWLARALETTELRAAGDGALDVHLNRNGRDVLVRGTARAPLVVACARCLTDVPFEAVAELALLLVPAETHAPARPRARRGRPEEVEIDADAAEVDRFESDEVVLDDFVREALLLEAPIFPLCSESCAGIAPVPGRASAEADPGRVDPRLARIVELRTRQKE